MRERPLTTHCGRTPTRLEAVLSLGVVTSGNASFRFRIAFVPKTECVDSYLSSSRP